MDLYRHGEQNHTPFRSRRLYTVNGQWYFQTREGKQFGPYIDRYEAKKALAVFISQHHCDHNTNNSDNNTLHHGVQDGIQHMVEELVNFFRLYNHNGPLAALAWASQRRKELLDNKNNNSENRERMEAITYAMEQE